MAETSALPSDESPDWEIWPYNQPGSAVLLEKSGGLGWQLERLFHPKTTFIELWEPCSGKHRVLRRNEPELSRMHVNLDEESRGDIQPIEAVDLEEKQQDRSDLFEKILREESEQIRIFLIPIEMVRTERGRIFLTIDDAKRIFSRYRVSHRILRRLSMILEPQGNEVFRIIRAEDLTSCPDMDGSGEFTDPTKRELVYSYPGHFYKAEETSTIYFQYDQRSKKHIIICFQPREFMWYSNCVEVNGVKDFTKSQWRWEWLGGDQYNRNALFIYQFQLPRSDLFKRNPLLLHLMLFQDLRSHDRWHLPATTFFKFINSKTKWRDLKKSWWQLRPRIQAQELLEQTLNAMTAINAGIDQNCSDRAMVQAEIDDLVDYVKSRKAVLELWKERVELLTSEFSDVLSKQTNRINLQIAQQTVLDGISMRTIAVVTLVFLPGAFISTFLSMAFFQGILSEWHKIWIYFAITVPVTILSLGAWLRYEQIATSNSGIQKQNLAVGPAGSDDDELSSSGSEDEGLGFRPVLGKTTSMPKVQQQGMKKRFAKFLRKRNQVYKKSENEV